MKIVYIIDCMYNPGGMERVLTVCANELTKNYDITILTAFQKGRPYFFSLNTKVKRVDLEVNDSNGVRQMKIEYKNKLSEYLNQNNFDIVVSLGAMDLDITHSIQDGSKKVVWFHFAIDIAETAWIGPHPSLMGKIKGRLRTWKRIWHARKYDKIVLLSQADMTVWRKYTNKCVVIYNPLTIEYSNPCDVNAKAVISVGRLCNQKGFDFLIDAWKIVAEKHADWKLNIYGAGGLKETLQQQIIRNRIADVVTLKGRSDDIAQEYSKHSIYVMSSRAEGFGLVLVEAASCGLPLVSFDCPSGPSELVINGKNGFLVDRVGDVVSMANAICKLIENDGLRKKMGIAARDLSQQFKIENIAPKWIELFDSVTE